MSRKEEGMFGVGGGLNKFLYVGQGRAFQLKEGMAFGMGIT